MQIRRFSSDLKTKIPGGHPGLYGVPIQFDRAHLPTQSMEELSERLNGLPILLNRPMTVVAMYLEPHGAMDEHSAEVPVLFLVTSGRGFVRLGGPNGETQSVSAGDAVLWPPGSIIWYGLRMSHSWPLLSMGQQSERKHDK